MQRTVLVILLLFSLAACDLISPPDNRDPERPTVVSTTPGDGEQIVSPDVELEAQLDLPNGPIDTSTLGNSTVKLTEGAGDALLSGNISFVDGNTIVFVPRNALDVEASYSFEITDGVKDESGQAVEPRAITFQTSSRPRIRNPEPRNRETGVNPEASVSLYPFRAEGGIDDATNTDDNIKLIEVQTNEEIAIRLGTSGGFDIITLDPIEALKENTQYRVEVTEGLKDQDGEAFIPFTSTFTTGQADPDTPGNVNFDRERVVQDGDSYTSLAIGPDRKLYATTVDGRIKRFPINADGTLGNDEVISSLQQAEGGPRLLIGFAFDPSATADNLVAWVSHTFVDENFTFKNINEPWSGKITRLSGPNLETVQDYVVGLPRSSKDHVTNSIAFNPAEPNALYFNQGSNTAMGAPDGAWNYREEQLLTAATLRLDISAVTSLPLNVQTEDTANPYDPFAAGAPLTVYGSGVRNAYDLVWHTNGELYVPTNGSNFGGVVPRFDLSGLPAGVCNGYTGPRLANENDVDGKVATDDRTDGWVVEDQVQSDFLFRVEAGGYYGHPNPKRCEWILNGGGGNDADSVDIYKNSTSPDPDYKGFAYNFERNKSPNGVIEYTSDTFGGALQGKLLVARYSNEDDILVLVPGGPDNDIIRAETPDDLDDFSDPLDLVEDTTNGNLYISEFDESQSSNNQGIVLLRPSE